MREHEIRAMVDRDTGAWDRQDAEALVSLFQPAHLPHRALGLRWATRGMKSLIAVIALAAIIACSESAPRPEASAQPKLAFKGYELYSWQREGEWHFALVPGTNRLKGWGELNAAAAPQGEVQRAIARLPRGETVTWCSRRVEGDGPVLEEPPPHRVRPLLDVARRNEVNLIVCGRDEKRAPDS